MYDCCLIFHTTLTLFSLIHKILFCTEVHSVRSFIYNFLNLVHTYWDDWVRLNTTRKGRQFLRPEVCRTYNFGEHVKLPTSLRVLICLYSFLHLYAWKSVLIHWIWRIYCFLFLAGLKFRTILQNVFKTYQVEWHESKWLHFHDKKVVSQI